MAMQVKWVFNSAEQLTTPANDGQLVGFIKTVNANCIAYDPDKPENEVTVSTSIEFDPKNQNLTKYVPAESLKSQDLVDWLLNSRTADWRADVEKRATDQYNIKYTTLVQPFVPSDAVVEPVAVPVDTPQNVLEP